MPSAAFTIEQSCVAYADVRSISCEMITDIKYMNIVDHMGM